MQIKRTDSKDKDFVYLVECLDFFLNDGRMSSLPQYNSIEIIKHVVVSYDDNKIPSGCAAIREYADGIMEVKRMFVIEKERGKEVAKGLLKELENWALELEVHRLILETGRDMFRAVSFYEKNGYIEIENYEPYVGNVRSICFEKLLTKAK